MKDLKIEEYSTARILLIISVIIILIPPLLTYPAFIKHLDFSKTGQIGDTLGGITTPFLSGLAALLVFLAFKAQIKANEIFKNQEIIRLIFDQISLIQNVHAEDFIDRAIGHIQDLKQKSRPGILYHFNKVLYFMSEVRLAYELIEKFPGEKKFLYKKLFYLYEIKYSSLLKGLEQNLNKERQNISLDYESCVYDILSEINYLKGSLNDVNKF